MTFKIGDRVRVISNAPGAAKFRGTVGTISADDGADRLYRWHIAEFGNEYMNYFSDRELALVEAVPPAREKTHDYMLGYAAGFHVAPEFLDGTQLRTEWANDSADYRAGFRAGVIANLNWLRDSAMAELDKATV